MEHFRNPFDRGALTSRGVLQNQQFFEELSRRARGHRFFSHPLFSVLDRAKLPPRAARFVLASFYKVVVPFTGLLCSLAGRAPNLQARFALMDNVYEELGRGEVEAAHPSLYLRMLASVGVSEQTADCLPTLPAIERINRHLRSVVDHAHFSVACAVLASAESTIAPSFPILAGIAQGVARDVDTAFFDRHGLRDEGHAADAAMLFAVTADETLFATVEAEVMLDLDYRSELNDAWMSALRADSAELAPG